MNTKRSLRVVVALLAVYIGSYLLLRVHYVEVWGRDGRSYVLIPPGSPWLYYLYRPLMYLDATVTGMRFHIGPHRDGGVTGRPTTKLTSARREDEVLLHFVSGGERTVAPWLVREEG